MGLDKFRAGRRGRGRRASTPSAAPSCAPRCARARRALRGAGSRGAAPAPRRAPSRRASTHWQRHERRSRSGRRATRAVLVQLPLGDLTSDQMRAVAALARQFGNGTLRATDDQNVVAPVGRRGGAAGRARGARRRRARRIPTSSTINDVVSCPGHGLLLARHHALDGHGRAHPRAPPAVTPTATASRRALGAVRRQDQRLPELVRPAPRRRHRPHRATSVTDDDGVQRPYYSILVGGSVGEGRGRIGKRARSLSRGGGVGRGRGARALLRARAEARRALPRVRRSRRRAAAHRRSPRRGRERRGRRERRSPTVRRRRGAATSYYRGTITRVVLRQRDRHDPLERRAAASTASSWPLVEIRGPIPRVGGLREGMRVGFDVGWTSSGLIVTRGPRLTSASSAPHPAGSPSARSERPGRARRPVPSISPTSTKQDARCRRGPSPPSCAGSRSVRWISQAIPSAAIGPSTRRADEESGRWCSQSRATASAPAPEPSGQDPDRRAAGRRTCSARHDHEVAEQPLAGDGSRGRGRSSTSGRGACRSRPPRGSRAPVRKREGIEHGRGAEPAAHAVGRSP